MPRHRHSECLLAHSPAQPPLLVKPLPLLLLLLLLLYSIGIITCMCVSGVCVHA